jgi:hypothetical protein
MNDFNSFASEYKIFKFDYNIIDIIDNVRESSRDIERPLSTETHGTLTLKDTNLIEYTNTHQNSQK